MTSFEEPNSDVQTDATLPKVSKLTRRLDHSIPEPKILPETVTK